VVVNVTWFCQNSVELYCCSLCTEHCDLIVFLSVNNTSP
jgi:hypothetical protein